MRRRMLAAIALTLAAVSLSACVVVPGPWIGGGYGHRGHHHYGPGGR